MTVMAMQPKVSGRELRRRLAAEADVARAALQNEELTRQRVEACERGLEYLASVLGRGFWGRLQWLAQGK